MARAKSFTGATTREMFSIGDMVNTNHQGPLKRPTESRSGLDDYGNYEVPEDLPDKPANPYKPKKGLIIQSTRKNPIPTYIHSRETTNEEVLHAEVLTLSEFGSLFKAPEFLDAETADMLNEASAEIMEHLRAPVLMNLNTLKSKDLPENIRSQHERDVAQGMESLRFLNMFSETLTAQDDINQELVLRVRNEEAGGIRLKFSPRNRSEILGELSGEPVTGVEIVIRNGENIKAAENTYTPMQLNFRFLNQGQEIRSLRIDMHNQNKGHNSKGEEKRLIQVDAVVGGVLAERSSKHKNITALCEQDDPEEAFRNLQYVFLSNLVRNKLTRVDAKGMLQLKENIYDADPNRDSTRNMGRMFKHGEQVLLEVAEKKSQKEAVESIAS